MRKFTLEEIRQIFSEVGLTLLDEEEKGIDYRHKCCDENGYLYRRSAHGCQYAAKKSKRFNGDVQHTFSTKNEFFYENMMLYMDKNVTNGTKLLSTKEEIQNIDMPLKFRCGICGEEFTLLWHSFVHKQDKCCNFCFNQKRKRGETHTNHIDTPKFHLKAWSNGLCILDDCSLRYTSKTIVQDSEGYRGMTSPAVIMNDSSFERFGYRNPFALDNLRLFAFKKGWKCIIYNQEYKGTDKPFKVLCECGNDFYVDADHFIGGKHQCNECRVKQSKIASDVQRWLEQHNIAFEKEKHFEGCAYKNLLPFDFYLSRYNACIEVDGLGHYRAVNFNGDKEKGQKSFERIQITDKIKTEYCEKHNIPLLRLPFWVIEKEEHGEKIQEFIDNLSVKSNELNN